MRHGLLLWIACLSAAGVARAQDNDSNLSAGGLAPPPAVESQGGAAGAPNGTEQRLEQADREDSGRGLEFVWLDGEVGIANVGLETFSATDFDASTNTTQTGAIVGAGLGARILFFTGGARFRYAPFSDWKLWTLGLEGGVHFPFGTFEPYATLGVGYASVVGLKAPLAPGAAAPGSGLAGGEDVAVHGVDGRLSAGIDLYLTNMFSIGVNLAGDVLFLSRPKLNPAGTVSNPAAATLYATDGSSTGAGVTFTAVGGLHF